MSGAGNGLSNNQLNLIFDGAYNNEETYLAPALIRRSGTGINNANAPALAYTAIGVSKTMMGVAVTPYNGMTPNFNYTKQTISWAFSLKNDKFKTFGELSPEPMNNCLNGPVKRANRNIARLFTHK